MNSNLIKISSIALVALGLGSCYKTIELDIPEQKLLAVVNPTQEEEIQVTSFILNKTMSIVDYRPGYDNNGIPYENNFEEITNATATLLENGKQVDKFTSSGSSNYRGGFVMTEGNTYELQVYLPNEEETLIASYRMPLCLPAIVTNYKEEEPIDSFMVGGSYTATVTVKDPEPSQKNYLRITVVDAMGVPIGFSSRSVILSDIGGEGEGFSGGSSEARNYGYAYAMDDLFDGTQFTFDLRFTGYQSGGPFFLEVCSIPRELYLYQKTNIQQEQNEGDPLAQPTEVYSNVKGGLGIFAYGSKKRTEIK